MELQLKITDKEHNTRIFKLGSPVSVSREVLFAPTYKGPNTFHLPSAQSETYSYKDQFIGDVTRGGSCNVDRLSYIPHTVTHIETSAHVLGPQESGVTIKDIPGQNLCGLAFLVDISHLEKKAGSAVLWQDIEEQINKITLPISILAIKTKSSLLPDHYDFSGKDFLYLSDQVAGKIHDLTISDKKISCLILDLPSIDRENDGGKLLAHRRYFGLPLTGHKGLDSEKRALVELAHFPTLGSGYYYVTISPKRFQANAVATGIYLKPLTEIPQKSR